jgi:hypothetical protein
LGNTLLSFNATSSPLNPRPVVKYPWGKSVFWATKTEWMEEKKIVPVSSLNFKGAGLNFDVNSEDFDLNDINNWSDQTLKNLRLDNIKNLLFFAFSRNSKIAIGLDTDNFNYSTNTCKDFLKSTDCV